MMQIFELHLTAALHLWK